MWHVLTKAPHYSRLGHLPRSARPPGGPATPPSLEDLRPWNATPGIGVPSPLVNMISLEIFQFFKITNPNSIYKSC